MSSAEVNISSMLKSLVCISGLYSSEPSIAIISCIDQKNITYDDICFAQDLRVLGDEELKLIAKSYLESKGVIYAK